MTARKKLRAIMAGKKLVLMPGAYDALSARVIEAEGFEAIVAGGYAGVGSMLAQADMGQSNMRDYASHYGRICDAVEIPVYVDADTGFGGVNNVRQMVRAFEAAGVAGLFISDQVFPNRCGYLPGKQIVPVEQMLAKVKAALDARRDPDLWIAARTDAFSVEGPEEAIARCQLFMEAGADMAKPMGFDTIPEIKRALREIPGPHMATLSQAAGPKARSLSELEAAGVSSATFPSIALFAAANAVRSVLRVLKTSDTLAPCQEHLDPARRLLQSGRAEGPAGARGELRQGGRPRWCRSAPPSSEGGCDAVCVRLAAAAALAVALTAARAGAERRGILQGPADHDDRRLRGRQRLRHRRAAAGALSLQGTAGQPDRRRAEHAAGVGVVAANYMALKAARDGSVIGGISRNLPSQAMMKLPNIEADPRKFIWLGATSFPGRVCVASTDAPVKTAADMFKTDLLTGARRRRLLHQTSCRP